MLKRASFSIFTFNSQLSCACSSCACSPRLPARWCAATPAAITSVLYIKPDHLGDLLLATPVLAALRQRLPNARVTALVGPWSRMVSSATPMSMCC